MDRRDFLKYLLSTAAASTIDYEQLLWIPGEKKIFIPSIYTGRAITLDEINKITMEIMLPQIESMFDRDSLFFSTFKDQKKRIIGGDFKL